MAGLASAVSAVIDYLKNQPDYSIWRAALIAAQAQVLATCLDRVLFAACSNDACIAAGYASGAQWILSDPNSFLYQITALPPCWPSSEVRLYGVDTLARDDAGSSVLLFLRASPESFILPSLDGGVVCDKVAYASCGSVLLLRPTFLALSWNPATTLQQALDAAAPELSYFQTWLQTAGLGLLPASPGAYTLLAPTNAAFDALAATLGLSGAAFVSSPAFAAMAAYHVALGAVNLGSSSPPRSAVASDGFLLGFSSLGCTAWFVNSAAIQLPGGFSLADNGALYVLDAVLGHGASGPLPTCRPLKCPCPCP